MNGLRAWLNTQLRATVTQQQLADAVEIGLSTVKRRERDGDAWTSGEIVTAARYWQLNPVAALLDLGHVKVNDVVDALQMDGKTVSDATDFELAHELAHRLRRGPALGAPKISADPIPGSRTPLQNATARQIPNR